MFEVERAVKDALMVLSCVTDDVEILAENVDSDFDVELEAGELTALLVVAVFVALLVLLLL